MFHFKHSSDVFPTKLIAVFNLFYKCSQSFCSQTVKVIRLMETLGPFGKNLQSIISNKWLHVVCVFYLFHCLFRAEVHSEGETLVLVNRIISHDFESNYKNWHQAVKCNISVVKLRSDNDNFLSTRCLLLFVTSLFNIALVSEIFAASASFNSPCGKSWHCSKCV